MQKDSLAESLIMCDDKNKKYTVFQEICIVISSEKKLMKFAKIIFEIAIVF